MFRSSLSPKGKKKSVGYRLAGPNIVSEKLHKNILQKKSISSFLFFDSNIDFLIQKYAFKPNCGISFCDTSAPFPCHGLLALSKQCHLTCQPLETSVTNSRLFSAYSARSPMSPNGFTEKRPPCRNMYYIGNWVWPAHFSLEVTLTEPILPL